MKILIITSIFPPATGGAATYFELLVRGLKNREDIERLVILTKFNSDAPIIEKQNHLTILRLLLPGFSWSNNSKLLRLLTIPLSRLQFPFITLCVVYFFEIKIIHAHIQIFRSFHYLLTFLKLLGKKIILDIRGLGAFPLNFDLLDRCCDKLICATTNTCRLLEKNNFPSGKAQFIPLPFKEPLPKPLKVVRRIKLAYEIPMQSPYICFVGNIGEEKGIFELLEAFEIFSQKKPKYKLLLVGKNMMGRRLFHKLSDNMVYLGPLSHEETLVIIQGSEALVLPSKAEGLPRVCLEAIALETKVLCPPNVPELQKYCPDFVIPKIEPEAIKRKLESVLNDDRIPTFPFENHQPEIVIDAVANLYLELISK